MLVVKYYFWVRKQGMKYGEFSFVTWVGMQKRQGFWFDKPIQVGSFLGFTPHSNLQGTKNGNRKDKTILEEREEIEREDLWSV